MAIDRKFIRDFLLHWEDRFLQGYIPCKKRNYFGREMHQGPDDTKYGYIIGASGVTIGAGVDLGQNTAEEMRAKCVPENLVLRFMPYFHKTKYNAANALFEKKLRISDTECDILDDCVHNYFINYAQKRYNSASKEMRFEDTPREVQAVITDLFYQLGGTSKYKKTWTYLINADWVAAENELKTGFTKYTNRRRDEGKLLEAIHV